MHEFIRVTLLIDIMDEITNLHVHFASVVYVDLVFKAVILTFHLWTCLHATLSFSLFLPLSLSLFFSQFPSVNAGCIGLFYLVSEWFMSVKECQL